MAPTDNFDGENWRDDPLENTPPVRKPPSKFSIRRAYLDGIIGLSDAIPLLMHDHAMDRGSALNYLGL